MTAIQSIKPSGVYIGSTNPVKINAVKQAIKSHWPEVKVIGLAVDSQIPAQPIGDEQTRLGARNRATLVLKTGLNQLKKTPGLYLGIGLEGGVVEFDGHLWSTVWGCVVDNSTDQDQALPRFYESNGARFLLPPSIERALHQGEELGPFMSRTFGGQDIKRTNGAIGVLTANFVDRTEEYSAIIKLAIGLWHGRINPL